ncbi:zinc ribbon domain-containing protein [Caldivirga sp. MU80]|uniref:zinc ribbon domain-containing protein n=1 Tax=Caldivirga sp. MU80 TaxID=1650354 RepID=UPI000832D768|nr:zinc ribbon domain-containing protein [Caldivirga sp. MU80]
MPPSSGHHWSARPRGRAPGYSQLPRTQDCVVLYLNLRLVRKALRHRALVIIDDIIEESRRELIEEKLPSGLRKIYLAETRRFVKLLIAQLEWYGVPYEFKRLPSTICPICGSELTQLQGRIMVCENCGFKAPRDKIPIHWALKAMPKAKVGSS